MITIEELKLGNRTLEALKFLLTQITELETAISQINISEIKDANTLTKEQIATLQGVKAAVESINTELSSKKTDFDEKKQNFDTNMNAFRNDKADFDEKKADFDSKNNTAISNFAFIASNVEKINSVSALLAEAKNTLETIKPIEQRTQAILNTIENSQAKFDELDALKATLFELKRSLENINTTGLISDNIISKTTTYSSTKINTLTQGILKNTDASENNAGGKIVRRNAAGNIYASNIYINEPTKAEVSTIKASLTADKWCFLVRNSDEGMLKSMSIKDFLAEQEVDAYTRSQSDAKFELKGTAYSKTESDAKYLRKVDKIDAYSKIECNATFLKKTEKIDSYSKTESDTRFAPITSLPPLATETKAGITKLKNIINAKQTDAAVTEKAVSDFVQSYTPPSIGVGQTWQNMLPQRQANVIYKNDTGKPIQLALYNNSGVSVSPNGSAWLTMPTASNATGAYPIIPNGWYYKASYAVGMWLELR
nr:MAG TPA: hypothetical protein [Caudoviricetes sp.]